MSYRELDTAAFSKLLKAELSTIAPAPSAWARLAPLVRKPAHRRAWRWTVSAALAGAAVLLAAVAAFAVPALTGQIIIHRVPAPFSGPGKGLPTLVKSPFATTLADAQQRAGFTAVTLANDNRASLEKVLYAPSANGLRGSVDLVYTIAGAKVQIVEMLDTRGSDAPLDVYLKAYPSGLAGLGSSVDRDTIDVIGGVEYLFLRTPDGSRTDMVIWKTANGIVVHLAPAYAANYRPNGLDRQTILEVISHLQ